MTTTSLLYRPRKAARRARFRAILLSSKICSPSSPTFCRRRRWPEGGRRDGASNVPRKPASTRKAYLASPCLGNGKIRGRPPQRPAGALMRMIAPPVPQANINRTCRPTPIPRIPPKRRKPRVNFRRCCQHAAAARSDAPSRAAQHSSTTVLTHDRPLSAEGPINGKQGRIQRWIRNPSQRSYEEVACSVPSLQS